MRLFEKDTRRLLASRPAGGMTPDEPSGQGAKQAGWEPPGLKEASEGIVETAEAERFSDALERESRRFGRALN